MFEDSKQLYDKLEYGFAIVFMTFVLIITLSFMTYIANEYSLSSLNEILAVSRRTPWGIITSLFVHANEKHLFNNMISLFFFFLLLLVSNVFHSKEELKQRILATLLLIFSIPAILNLFLILCFPDFQMIGSSGIVYALEGICIGFSLVNGLELRKIRKSVRSEKRTLLASSLSNLIVFASFFLNVVLYPLLFPSTGPQIIVSIHGLAFCGGFSTALMHVSRQSFKARE